MALLAVALAIGAGIDAAANYWRTRLPERTLWLRHDDPVALSLQTDVRLADADASQHDSRRLTQTARTALSIEPLTAPALRQLAWAKAFAGNVEPASATMLLAHHVSRRDQGTLIALIQESLARGDVQTMFAYSDEVFAIGDVAADAILPALSAAMFDPALRRGLIPYLRKGRSWVAALLGETLSEPDGERYAVDVVLHATHWPAAPQYDWLAAKLLSTLATEAKFESVRAVLPIISGEPLATTEDLRFSRRGRAREIGPFAWQFAHQYDLESSPASDGSLDIQMGPDQQGVVAKRILLLDPGRYRISEDANRLIAGTPAGLTWELRCLSNKSRDVIWSQAIAGASADPVGGKDFTITAGCRGQELTMIASSEDRQGRATVHVRRSWLRRIG